MSLKYVGRVATIFMIHSRSGDATLFFIKSRRGECRPPERLPQQSSDLSHDFGPCQALLALPQPAVDAEWRGTLSNYFESKNPWDPFNDTSPRVVGVITKIYKNEFLPPCWRRRSFWSPIYPHMHACVFTCMWVCLCVGRRVSVYVSVNAFISVFVYVCKRVCM